MRTDDPLNCQEGNQLSYEAAEEQAVNRMAKGEFQKLCALCARWRFKDSQCDKFIEAGSRIDK